MRHDHILQTIGRTPVVRLAALEPPGVEVYAKLEAFNPLGSVKDRMALAVIEDAEARGRLAPGQTVVEATSGNTGIGLAMVCARKGYPLVIVMAENFSVERRRLLRFLGARVVLTPASEKGSGMLAKAVELAERHGWFLCRQFENPANVEIHRLTTAEEIWNDTKGEIDVFVSGVGTGGTITGVAQVLKPRRPGLKIIAVEPEDSPVLSGGQPGPHKIQGIGAGFVPPILDRSLIDEVLTVGNQTAFDTARLVARLEGVPVGISSGAALTAAIKLGQREENAGKTIVVIIPSFAERYLSTALFAGLGE